MMTFPWERPVAGRHYLLAPVMPTPNGRLHLGHIAGPFLRMDVIARYLRRRGDRARIIFGTDSYDSYVPLAAVQEGRSNEEICSRYHELIRHDLSAMDIEVDEFVNPEAPRWTQGYHRAHREFLAQLVRSGKTVTIRERVPYDTATGRYLVGGFLSGRCPDCSAEVSNFLCESCGGHLLPESLREPRPRLAAGPVEWREVPSLFLRIPPAGMLLRHLESMGIPGSFIDQVGEYVAEHGPLARLTTPGQWGVSTSDATAGASSVFFSYTGILPYSLYCGELFSHAEPGAGNPFAPESEVVTVTSCGTDNIVTALVSVIGGALAHGGVKPFDHVLLNHLYSLEGKKFSTSRRHAIWAADAASLPTVSTDSLRYYLSAVNPELAPENLSLDDYVRVHNSQLASALSGRVRQAAEAIQDGGRPDDLAPDIAIRLAGALRAQDDAFELSRASMAHAAAPIRSWLQQGALDRGQEYWWLKGLALLSYPVMPRLGTSLWSLLGHDGVPSLAGFRTATHPRQAPIPSFAPITRADLTPCLPDSISQKGEMAHA
jgi:methionyl-tRNA synthetase